MKKVLNLIIFLFVTFSLTAQTEPVVSTFLTRPGTLFEAITWAPDGRIFTLDFQTGDLFQMDIEGNIITLGNYPGGIIGGAMDTEGNFYFSDFSLGKIQRLSPDGQIIEYASGFNQPTGILIDDENQIMYVANYGNDRISMWDMAGLNSEPVTLAEGFPISGPDGLVFSPEGNIISANFDNNRVQTITPTGEVSTLAVINGAVNTGYIIPWENGYMTPSVNSHNLYTISYDGEVTKLCIPGGNGYIDGPLEDAKFSFPNGIAVSPTLDSILITESQTDGRIRLLTFEEIMPPSAVAESSMIESIVISPNPAGEYLNLTFLNQESGQVEITLSDLSGRVIDTLFTGKINQGKFERSFKTKKETAAGTYLLHIKINGNVYGRKVIF